MDDDREENCETDRLFFAGDRAVVQVRNYGDPKNEILRARVGRDLEGGAGLSLVLYEVTDRSGKQ